MFFQKKGFPEESEIVICTVSKINYHSVFVTLNDYANKSAMLHISEISPGRIRNIKDYVKEGKVIVCKVLKVDSTKGHIDVSLRRVNENQRRDKIDFLKQEQKAEKIVEFVAKEHKKDSRKLYVQLLKDISKDYDCLHQAFNDFVAQDYDFSNSTLDKPLLETLKEVIRQRISPPEVIIKAKLHLETYDSKGVEKIKSLLLSFLDGASDFLSIHYLGAGTHHLELKGDTYEPLEKRYCLIKDLLEAQGKVIKYKLDRC